MLTCVLYPIIKQELPMLSRSFVFLIKYNDFDDHIDVILAAPASDPNVVAAAPEVPIKVSACVPATCVLYVITVCLYGTSRTSDRRISGGGYATTIRYVEANRHRGDASRIATVGLRAGGNWNYLQGYSSQ